MSCSGTDAIAKLHERLRQLWIRLHESELNGTALVKVIVQITEVLVSGETHSDNSNLRAAQQHGVLVDFARILSSGEHVPQIVKVQLLQTFMILLQSVRTAASMTHILKDNFVNCIITTSLDWHNDEIIAYYICFLKSIAMRLEKWSMPYFYSIEDQYVNFPLYTEAVRFFCHRDHMVRAAVRTLTLRIYSIDDERLRHLIVEHSAHTYFTHLACHLCELWRRFDKLVTTARKSKAASRMLHDINEQQKDLLIYISDVMELGVLAINDAIAEQLLRYCFLPVLLQSLTKMRDPTNLAEQLLRDTSLVEDNIAETQVQLLGFEVALFLIHQVFSIFRNGTILEPLLVILLRKSAPRDLLTCCSRPSPPFPATYRAMNGFLCGPGGRAFASSQKPIAHGPRLCSMKAHPKPHGDSLFLNISSIDGCTQSGPNHVRQQFLLGLSSRQDVHVLLTVGIIHTCVTRHCGILHAVLGRSSISSVQDLELREQIPHATIGRRRESTVCVDETMQAAFDELDVFLDHAIDITSDLCGSPYVLTEVQNLPMLSKSDESRLSSKPARRKLPCRTVAASKLTNDNFKQVPSAGDSHHPDIMELLVCASDAFEHHAHLREPVLGALALLVLEIARRAKFFHITDALKIVLSTLDDVEHSITLGWLNIDADTVEGCLDDVLDIADICGDVHGLLVQSEVRRPGCADDFADNKQNRLRTITLLRKEVAKYAYEKLSCDLEDFSPAVPRIMMAL